MRAALAASSLFVPAHSFIYKIDNTFNLTSHASYSEGWMYGSNEGPRGAPQGESYVDVDFEVNVMRIFLGLPYEKGGVFSAPELVSHSNFK